MAAVPVSWMKSYSLDSNSIDEIGRAADLLKTMPLYVIDDAATVEDVRYSMLEMAAHKGAKLFVLDYVQLLTSTATKKSDNRNNELAHISRTLKLTAMQTDAANIVIAQLNRETEKRAGKRPQLSDLRDSGALEADADVVIFPFDPAKNKMQGQGELIVEKQRDGKTGSIPVDWKEPGFFYPAQDFDPVQFAPAADSWNTLKINGIKPHDEEDVPF
jgi:replicative DNA helicase